MALNLSQYGLLYVLGLKQVKEWSVRWDLKWKMPKKKKGLAWTNKQKQGPNYKTCTQMYIG